MRYLRLLCHNLRALMRICPVPVAVFCIGCCLCTLSILQLYGNTMPHMTEQVTEAEARTVTVMLRGQEVGELTLAPLCDADIEAVLIGSREQGAFLRQEAFDNPYERVSQVRVVLREGLTEPEHAAWKLRIREAFPDGVISDLADAREADRETAQASVLLMTGLYLLLFLSLAILQQEMLYAEAYALSIYHLHGASVGQQVSLVLLERLVLITGSAVFACLFHATVRGGAMSVLQQYEGSIFRVWDYVAVIAGIVLLSLPGLLLSPRRNKKVSLHGEVSRR